MSLKESKCKGCGKPIIWADTPEARKIPLDPRAPVYFVDHDEEVGVTLAVRNLGYMVTHFATCSHAAKFSASKKACPK